MGRHSGHPKTPARERKLPAGNHRTKPETHTPPPQGTRTISTNKPRSQAATAEQGPEEGETKPEAPRGRPSPQPPGPPRGRPDPPPPRPDRPGPASNPPAAPPPENHRTPRGPARPPRRPPSPARRPRPRQRAGPPSPMEPGPQPPPPHIPPIFEGQCERAKPNISNVEEPMRTGPSRHPLLTRKPPPPPRKWSGGGGRGRPPSPTRSNPHGGPSPPEGAKYRR
ncbi:hypothetical protein CgunFtcFv8_018890 [Champsocephalus gunnari]|uniref:Uncharacterized protein n=1 Tax=Champsocephalus gunnari TaxID=52237 RepID=A0AAN8HN58_CHAGU|nr:hypothetical protein CgunFtcFv8_018890 [Champsocephalus gunnari]